MRDQVSYPYKATTKITGLLDLRFSQRRLRRVLSSGTCSLCCLLFAAFFLSFLFDPEYGACILLRNAGWLHYVTRRYIPKGRTLPPPRPSKYERESVGGPQLNIKRKTCDIRTWGKKILDVSSSIDTHVPSLWQCVETRSVEIFLKVVLATSAPPFEPLPQQRNVCHPVVNRFTRQALPAVNRRHFFMNILCIEFFFTTRKWRTELSFLVVHFSSTIAILTTETSIWTCACASDT
jgi:hypothetical protein